jgi:hypothetical protein
LARITKGRWVRQIERVVPGECPCMDMQECSICKPGHAHHVKATARSTIAFFKHTKQRPLRSFTRNNRSETVAVLCWIYYHDLHIRIPGTYPEPGVLRKKWTCASHLLPVPLRSVTTQKLMSITSGRVSLNNLSQGRCVPRSSKKKAKLAKRAAKILARRENETLQRPSTAVASRALDDSASQEVVAPISVTSARDLGASDNREPLSLCDLTGAGDSLEGMQPHILAYCSHMSSSTVEMIRNTAAGQLDNNDMDGSCMQDSAMAGDLVSELGWQVVDNCPPLEEEDEEDEEVEEEGFLVVHSS